MATGCPTALNSKNPESEPSDAKADVPQVRIICQWRIVPPTRDGSAKSPLRPTAVLHPEGKPFHRTPNLDSGRCEHDRGTRCTVPGRGAGGLRPGRHVDRVRSTTASLGEASYGYTGQTISEPAVGMAPTPDAGGYWLVGADGGVFSFGDAQFLRIHRGHATSTGRSWGWHRRPTGAGTGSVASDGGIFSFGDARFFGSTGGIDLNRPIVGMAPTPDGRGYWLLASDGGIFSFGDASSSAPPGACNSTGRSWGWRRHPTGAATGSSPPTAASSRSGTPGSSDPPGACTSIGRSWGWPTAR